MALLPPSEAMARMTAKMAVVSATRRLNVLSRRSSSSSGLGSSTSATRWRRPLLHLFSHRVLARLERGHQALRLLLEQFAALVEQLAGAALGLGGHRLGLARPLAVAQQLARLASRLGGYQQRRGGADDPAQEEPTQIAPRIVAITCHDCCLLRRVAGDSRTHPRPAADRPPGRRPGPRAPGRPARRPDGSCPRPRSPRARSPRRCAPPRAASRA